MNITAAQAPAPSVITHYIAGRPVTSSRPPFANIDPATGEVAGHVHEADEGIVDQAVRAAREALRGPWGRLTDGERATILRRLADGIRARFDEFLAAEMRDTGKPYSLASHLDIPRGAANFDVFADQLANGATEAFRSPTPDGGTALNYGLRTPRGVIAVICPWNLPLLLMTWKVAPALAFGNTVIVKPSEETPRTTTLLAEVMNDAGVPPGVFNVVHGFGPDSAGQYLTEHPDVDAITFTGETRTGTAIMKAAAAGIRPVSFELGGKNAALVFADCDLDAAIAGVTRSAFLNSGQVCLGTERIYVERPIFDTFVARLKEAAEALRPGDPNAEDTTFGPLISQAHRDKVLSYYARARNEGATIVTGGGVPSLPAPLSGGWWVEPTIWTGLAADSAVLTEEIFGPCCHIAPFDREEEAVAAANDSPYGLATSVWTRDLSRAHRVAAAIQVGVAWVNCWFLRDLRTAFGGAKQSGIGREGGVHGLEFYTELRNVCIKL
ncbi:2-hydroxymuconic semialdehyde dehydrogenase [Stenotrophomonas mori]|uniref:2-hydroxymuconic semialdehyde dehydrogenase n=1 Tax=Stenotrophomonas mori TaxID=2871096 RepID=A0ABT0SLE9_9GAMM|nr:2-hydroxymuconic semialdehyde dehydrogenase [Stenotrophomonas mori]MCL7715744.1 2-hydroxymuconic semialdehyde dehydrogenase [Stenotrophomonas mori]